MRFHRAIFFAASLGAAAASATPTFTGVMQTELMMSGPPPGVCGVCHLNGVTTTGTVTTPFGRAVRMNGLMANNDASLRAALTALTMANTDSDGDGCSDIAELKGMPSPTNPNVATDCSAGGDGGTMVMDGGMGGGGAGGGGPTIGPIRYGCGANSVPELMALAAVVALALRARRS
ncbi:MAG: hypothetical protein JNJ54_12345 [Myxococcaceae bacterium]|nr:hypothetical protein [Myxococcaceae bacterium]